MEQFKGLYDRTLDKMEVAQEGKGKMTTGPRIFRVIDDGTCVLTTIDAEKALIRLVELIDKHDVTACWAEREDLE